MLREDDSKRPISGGLRVNDITFSNVERDGKFDFWSHDDDVSVPDIAAAYANFGRFIR